MKRMGRASAIHIVNPMRNAAGGSENRALNLYRTLRGDAPVTLWGDGGLHPRFAGEPGIRRIAGRRLGFPKRGTFVFVGVYFRPGRWIWFTRPSRVIIVYNTPDLPRLEQTRLRFRRAFRIEPEIVYCSEKMRDEAALPGIVETSLFDAAAFAPAGAAEPRPDDRCTIGRLSRPNPYKHHPDDPAFYARLVAAGCRVRVMGATDEMVAADTGSPLLGYLPSMAIDAPTFLRGLDVFFYRTAPSWREPWGRVITEAMASGLPVVATAGGGYAEIIEHGVNGYLFETEEEAFAILMALRDDPALRRAVGEAGRRTILALTTSDARAKIVDYYMREPA